MDLKSDSNYKSEILDIIKSLKVNGSFDQFRKDCFAEILTQPSFQSLKKNVEDYVFKYLTEHKLNSSTKKTVLRDQIRRSLIESHFMNEGINDIIEEIVEPKLEKTFIDKIETMVNREIKDSLTESTSSAQVTTNINLNNSLATNITIQQECKVKKIISVEDFIPVPEKPAQSIKIEPKKPIVTKPATTPTHQPPKIIKDKPKPIEIVNKPVKKEFVKIKSSDLMSDKAATSKSMESDAHKLKNASSLTADDEDTDLEADPTNEYNFKWKLTSGNLDSFLDDLSVSSVNTTDLSDFEN